MLKELTVYVNATPVGQFSAELQSDGHTTYRFIYHDKTSVNDLVSLTMPVENSEYPFNIFPPAFDMILPEGERRTRIQAFRKIVDTDPFSLLFFVGGNAINRVRFISKGNENIRIPVIPEPAIIKGCEDGRSLFKELVNTFNENQGIAGVMPKILGRGQAITGTISPSLSNDRSLSGSDYILKTSTEKYPFLGVNEYLSLNVYDKAGLDTPDVTMSEDGSLLLVKRFDIIDDSNSDVMNYKGFEEVASLMGETSESKYHRDYGSMISCLEDFIDADNPLDITIKLLKSLVLNWMIGNGDAHLKNFGVLYESANNVSLSPFYDVICTKAYIPNDIPALALSESYYSKSDWPEDQLKHFVSEFGSLNKKGTDDLFDECRQAVSESKEEINQYRSHLPEFDEIGKRMYEIWQSKLTANHI